MISAVTGMIENIGDVGNDCIVLKKIIKKGTTWVVPYKIIKIFNFVLVVHQLHQLFL